MKIKRFDQLTESDAYIEYTIEDSQKLAANILNEWETKKPSKQDQFLRGRMLGALETILTLNGKLHGGKPYDYESEDFEVMMIRMTTEFVNEELPKKDEKPEIDEFVEPGADSIL